MKTSKLNICVCLYFFIFYSDLIGLIKYSCIYRTMQTAVGVFGNEDKQHNITSSPSIVALEVARDRNVRLIHVEMSCIFIID